MLPDTVTKATALGTCVFVGISNRVCETLLAECSACVWEQSLGKPLLSLHLGGMKLLWSGASTRWLCVI